jgi:hypothetical protein
MSLEEKPTSDAALLSKKQAGEVTPAAPHTTANVKKAALSAKVDRSKAAAKPSLTVVASVAGATVVVIFWWRRRSGRRRR